MPKDSDRTLVLCPGFMTDHGLWAEMKKGLESLGRVQFADQSQDSSFTDIAQRVLGAAPAQFTLIGFSMGGYVAREVLRLAPGRVKGLVLINTSARPETQDVARRNVNLTKVTQAQGFRGLSTKALGNALHPSRQHDEQLIDALQQMALRMGEAAFLNQLAIVRKDDRPELADITCPTLVVWSRQDALRSLEEALELKDAIANARLEIIEDCGHLSTMERPDEVNQAMREWLA